uniref:Uncharacterized protein n=1 Tax=Oryza glumipatula TaxID=40148 RepID=A0A0E0BCZ8_9ORYZ
MTATKADTGRRLSRTTGGGMDRKLQMFQRFSKLLLSTTTQHRLAASRRGRLYGIHRLEYKLELSSPARCHDDADAAVKPQEAMNVDS